MRTSVPFRSVPHQSELFLRYVELAPPVLTYYAHPPTLDGLDRACRNALGAPVPRPETAAILRRQNRALGNDPCALELIDVLECTDSVAIVTGQQVGIFGGPLYTLFKALTAIDLAAGLRARGVPAVPVFWMDADDHDLAEVTHFTRLGPTGAPERIDARTHLFPDAAEGSAHPVGAIRFPDAIRRVTATLLESLPESPAREEARARLEAAYRPGASLAESFGRLVAGLLGPSGLVLFDPSDPASKPLVAPVFQTAVRNVDAIYDALVSRNHALGAEGFASQVHVLEHSTVLFLTEDGERRALVRHPEGFLLKNSSRRFTVAELANLAGSAPERFSPNVLLRPIVQDSLFPTAAYVAGPAEIAYFAQVEALYGIFGRPMPVIWPRASFTLVEADVAAAFEGAGLEFEDCLAGKHHLVEKLIASSGRSSATARAQELGSYLATELEELRPALVATDASLGPALDTAKRKILHQVSTLETKLVHFEARHDHRVLEAADFLLDRCYPNKSLQERQLGIASLLGRHGPGFLRRVAGSIRATAFHHQILKLG